MDSQLLQSEIWVTTGLSWVTNCITNSSCFFVPCNISVQLVKQYWPCSTCNTASATTFISKMCYYKKMLRLGNKDVSNDISFSIKFHKIDQTHSQSVLITDGVPCWHAEVWLAACQLQTGFVWHQATQDHALVLQWVVWSLPHPKGRQISTGPWQSGGSVGRSDGAAGVNGAQTQQNSLLYGVHPAPRRSLRPFQKRRLNLNQL